MPPAFFCPWISTRHFCHRTAGINGCSTDGTYIFWDPQDLPSRSHHDRSSSQSLDRTGGQWRPVPVSPLKNCTDLSRVWQGSCMVLLNKTKPAGWSVSPESQGLSEVLVRKQLAGGVLYLRSATQTPGLITRSQSVLLPHRIQSGP